MAREYIVVLRRAFYSRPWWERLAHRLAHWAGVSRTHVVRSTYGRGRACNICGLIEEWLDAE